MQLNVREWGSPESPPLICVHGVGGYHGEFARVAEDRWSKHFRVIAVDLRGHHDSGWEPPWNNATHVADLLETIDSLAIDRPDWVGFSFGGRLLFELIERHADRVRRGVAIEPVIQAPAAIVRHRAEQELTGDVWESIDAFIASKENAGAEIDVAQLRTEVTPQFQSLDDGTVRRRTCQPAVVSIFSEFAAPAPPPETVNVPTMIIRAAAMGLVTEEQRAAYAPHVEEIVDVPGMHLVLLSAYEETASAVQRFLA